MRLGILLQSLDETWGGIGIYTQEVLRHLLAIDRQNEYVLIYPGFGNARARRGQFQHYGNVVEIETKHSRIPIAEYWDQMIVPSVARRHGVDVLFNPFLSVPIRGRFGKVMIMHGVEVHVMPEAFSLTTTLRWRFMERFVVPAADRLISISNTMTRDFPRWVRYPIERIRTIYHGVSDQFAVIKDPDRLAEVRQAYALDGPFILFVGNLFPNKNLAGVVRALARIKDRVPHKLLVVGGRRWMFEADLDLVHSLQLTDRVQFTKFVPGRHLPLLYNLADCFVYPSFYESFGLAQLEAMACGCPVIGARSGAIPEVSGDAALLFDPHNPEELADAILRVLCDTELREELVTRGLARAKEFTWDRCARQTLAVLEELQ